jgi:serine/threonine protein kinase
VVNILVQCCQGIVHLHAQRILHRDIRCDNMLVFSTAPLVVQVGDFGLSHSLQDGDPFASTLGPIGVYGALVVCGERTRVHRLWVSLCSQRGVHQKRL